MMSTQHGEATLYNIMTIDAIIYVSKPRESTTARVNPDVNFMDFGG